MEKESKVSPVFREVIKSYLDKRAEGDEAFAREYANPQKSVDECCNYILGEVRRTRREAMTDDEVFGLAVHYYDEEGLTAEPVTGVHVVVPGVEEAPAAAAPKVVRRPKERKKEAESVQQLSLF